MNACLRGREMLLALQRSDFLPPWDEESMRTIVNEMIEEHNRILHHTEGCNVEGVRNLPESIRASISYNMQCMQRNRRYINSYLTHRLAKIRSLRWEVGAVLPDRIRHDILSARENDFYASYCRLISDYNSSIGLDLASDIEPPKDLFIEVRVIKPCGEIMTENGSIQLDLGSTHYLRRADVEHLIRQGSLKHIQGTD